MHVRVSMEMALLKVMIGGWLDSVGAVRDATFKTTQREFLHQQLVGNLADRTPSSRHGGCFRRICFPTSKYFKVYLIQGVLAL